MPNTIPLLRRIGELNEVVEVDPSSLVEVTPARMLFEDFRRPMGLTFDEISVVLRVPREQIEDCWRNKGYVDQLATKNLREYLKCRISPDSVAFLLRQQSAPVPVV